MDFDSGGGFGDLGELFAGWTTDGWSSPAATTSPDTGGSSWGSFFKDIARLTLPSLASTGVGMAASALFPGTPAKTTITDTRQPQTIAGSDLGLARLNALNANPMSFGLPGDPYDINTPAGKKRYDIIKQVRSADAARGMLNTGGSGVRETDALNRAIGEAYNTVWKDASGVLAAQPPQQLQQIPAQPNPWAKLLAGALGPAASKTTDYLLGKWGVM